MQFYYKYKFFINTAIKGAVLCLLFWAIYHQVFREQRFYDVLHQLSTVYTPLNLLLLGGILFFVFVNWGIEAYKWQILINQEVPITFFSSYRAVLGGVTLSTIAPNRIGEYIGRVFFIDHISKGNALSLTGVGILSQIVMVCIWGVVGLEYFLFTYADLATYMDGALLLSSGLLLVILLFVYYKVPILPQWTARKRWFRKIQKYIEVIQTFKASTLSYILFITFLRYVVFSLQYWLLLKVFGVNIGWTEGLLIIGLIFFVQMAFPYPALAELGVRGNVALFFLGAATEQSEVGIISAAFSLWLVNLILPALVGSYFVLEQKFLK